MLVLHAFKKLNCACFWASARGENSQWFKSLSFVPYNVRVAANHHPWTQVPPNQRRGMRMVESLTLVLLWTLSYQAAGLNIPLEVKQPPTITSHSETPIIVLPLDNSVTITCEARGNPPPIYRWTKDGEDVTLSNITSITSGPTSGALKFHGMALRQVQGKYRCFASNQLGTAMTNDIEIIVSGSPKFPKETIPPVVVNEGDPVILECNPPEAVVPRQLYWMTLGLEHIKQDKRVSMGTDGNLYFSNALENDSRQDYCCSAAFPRIRTMVQQSPMVLEVKSMKPANGSSAAKSPPARAPSMLLPSGVQTEKVLMKGEELQLECITAGFPTPDVTWMKMGEELSDRTKLRNFDKLLTISAVEETDQGKYMCTASNSAGKTVHYFRVIVEEPPIWLGDPPQGQITTIGSDVHIKCSVGGTPLPDITWKRNGELFKDDSENYKRVLDDTVVLHNAMEEDSGVYQCEASNRHGRILANINILVMSKPPLILTKDVQEYAVILGNNILINCSVFSSPPASISWMKEEAVLTGERFSAFDNNQSLKIMKAETSDSGKYECVAKNTEGSSSITALLDVKEPTKIVSPPQNKQIISGTSAKLVCEVTYDKSLQDSFELEWRKDGEKISPSEENSFRYIRGDHKLQIMNVNLRDQGLYTCIARTRLDEVNATALIIVLDVPDAPERLKIIEIKDSRNIVISWTPGSDHNSSITEFVVEYEENQWEPGRWKELKRVPGNQATAELALFGNLRYQFRVYAVNAIGPGTPSEPSERHSTDPTVPDRNPENIQIHGNIPYQMEISWSPLLLTESNGPGIEYKVSYRRLEVEDAWTEQLVQRPLYVVKGTPAFTPYEIKVHARNSFGWGPEPKVVTGYSGEDTPSTAPQDVAVEVINTTAVRVSWTQVPAATVRGHLQGYEVQWVRTRNFLDREKTLNEKRSESFPGNRSHAIVAGLKPYSEYKLTVRVVNKKGKGPMSDPVTFTTPEGAPGLLPTLTASDCRADSMLLVWGPPLETNGILFGYHLQYHLLNESTKEVIDSQEMNITGADITQWRLTGLNSGSRYRIHLRACTKASCGPPQSKEGETLPTLIPALLNISSYVSDTFAKISWTATEEQRELQLYVAYMNNRDGKWHFSEAINVSQSFHIIDGLKPGTKYTVRLMAKKLLDNASFFEDVIQTQIKGKIEDPKDASTTGWIIGTMCALALLVIVALIFFCLMKKKGGKYAVKEKEDLHCDTESQGMMDECSKPRIHEFYQDQPGSPCSQHLTG
ncbi:neural cell adhesion molecule L1-like protein isoform X2 [Oryzias melastigma]|uniref:Neural cell adhesion molecule L1-like protein n=1 Tax=Oryzias melastigma TaxID=30732 RepID=A0A3B3BBJ2_ORYME|nr:neural cell adhesion molecule L1-like protein isoform X2 [Oryzias melastigma]